MKYFTTCTTLDELKKEFRRLAMLHHPDHSKKKCWYARNTEQHLQALRAIETDLTA